MIFEWSIRGEPIGNLSLLEHYVLHMISHKHGHIVARLVPLGLAGHVVVDSPAVDFESFEGDVLHLAFLVVAIDEGEIRHLAIVADVAEGHILHPKTWSRTILVVPTHLHLQEAALVKVLDANIVKKHVAFTFAVSSKKMAHAIR